MTSGAAALASGLREAHIGRETHLGKTQSVPGQNGWWDDKEWDSPICSLLFGLGSILSVSIVRP